MCCLVYLRTTPEIVFERIKARGRPEETGMTLEYLTDLHRSHDEWLMGRNNNKINTSPVLVLNADECLESVIEQYKLYEQRILGQQSLGDDGGIKEEDKI